MSKDLKFCGPLTRVKLWSSVGICSYQRRLRVIVEAALNDSVAEGGVEVTVSKEEGLSHYIDDLFTFLKFKRQYNDKTNLKNQS